MKKVVIVSGIQIIDNPRVVKEATALSDLGFNVEVLGAIYNKGSKDRTERILKTVSWQHFPVIDLTDNRLFRKFYFFLSRLRLKIFYRFKQWFNYESPEQLGYFTKRLFKLANDRNADLYIVHLEQALWVGRELIKSGHKVAIDVEDWYSEDGLPADRALKPEKLMKACESYLLNNSVYSTTTSIALSIALKDAYRCPLPTVVYNSFPSNEREFIDGKILDRKNTSIPSIVWFSQTIGPGRGLEQLITALNEIDCQFELHIRGDDRREFSRILYEKASSKYADRIYFHSQVPQDELLSRLSEHDIGFCGDLSDCKSRNATITNKILEYLRAGLAVIASDTEGHKEVKQFAGNAITIYEQRNASSLVKNLELLLKDSATLEKRKILAIESLNTNISWEKSSESLKLKVKSCLIDN